MEYEVYNLLHILGLMLLFGGLGALAFGKRDDKGKPPVLATILHGVGLVVMLVAGFGMLARLFSSQDLSTPWTAPWLSLKLVTWLVLGALPILVRRKVVPPVASLFLAVALGGFAAYLAINKPVWW